MPKPIIGIGVKLYDGIPKRQEAVKAALQRVFPFVEFKRVRYNGRQIPAIRNLQWLEEDETPGLDMHSLEPADELEFEEDGSGRFQFRNTQSILRRIQHG